MKKRSLKTACYHLFLLSVLTTQAQQVDTVKRLAAVSNDYAHWAPDNKRIVFTSNFSGKWQVYLRDIVTKKGTRLTNNEGNDDFPTWSPDGKKIAFQTVIGDTQTLWVMNPDGSFPRKLVESVGVNIHPTWHPGSQFILFNSNREDTSGLAIYKIGIDGNNLTRLTNPSETSTYAWWSPDAKKISFVRWRKIPGSDKEEGDVCVMNENGTNIINLTNNPAMDGWPSWSPDGRKLLFSSNRTGKFQIYMINADGTGIMQVLQSDSNDRQPYLSPDGTRISFNRQLSSGGSDIFMIELKK